VTSLLLRADASPVIGVGHVARVTAYAEQAVRRGWRVAFSGRIEGVAWAAERLGELAVRRLPPVADAAGLGALARDFDAVLVDHYGPGELREAVNRAGAVLVSVEDDAFGRRPADIVVDCGLAPAPRPDDGSAVLLRGARFAPLRESVRAARAKRLARPVSSGDRPRVTVVLGGGAWGDVVSTILVALRDTGLPCQVDALVRGEAELPSPGPGQQFRVAPPTPVLADVLARSDLVVSAAGVTLLELCCVGAPAAVVQLVDNQAGGYRAALELGLAEGLGPAATLALRPGVATGVLAPLLADGWRRARLAATASTVVDGRGAERALDAVERALAG
jgi:spore coat polysaccharide biosynthesis predicted glycosyltransferase SpsG